MFRTIVRSMRMRSLFNSFIVRAEPQLFSLAIRMTSSRISSAVRGHPGFRWDFFLSTGCLDSA
jgi:hypothetical protein